MQAVELQSFACSLVVVERVAPTIGSGEELIDVTACGVCHSDIHVVDGQFGSPLPLIPGHEVTGVHHRLGPVIVYAPWGCRHCWLCDTGHEMICPDSAEAGLFSDGGYAEQMRVPRIEYLNPLGDLDPIASAPLPPAGVSLRTGLRNKRSRCCDVAAAPPAALVIGAGGLGQFGIQYLRPLTDADVWVTDPAPAKRQRAVELGATAAVALDELDGKFDAIIDFVGADRSRSRGERITPRNRRGRRAVRRTRAVRLGAVPHEARFMSSIWGTNVELGELLAFANCHRFQHTVGTSTARSRSNWRTTASAAGDVAGRFVLVPAGMKRSWEYDFSNSEPSMPLAMPDRPSMVFTRSRLVLVERMGISAGSGSCPAFSQVGRRTVPTSPTRSTSSTCSANRRQPHSSTWTRAISTCTSTRPVDVPAVLSIGRVTPS